MFRLYGGAIGTTISVIAFYQIKYIFEGSSFVDGFKFSVFIASLLSLLGILFCYPFKSRFK